METKSIIGCLVGTAVGDAIGLPCEGLSSARQTHLFGDIHAHRLFFGHGMISDDTEHTCLVAHAMIAAHGDPEAFSRSLAWGLRGWFLSLSPGMGLATARACLKLLIGIPPTHSGVFSAGNGPAMRAAILGVCVPAHELPAYIARSSHITHTDPQAEQGALAVARAAEQFATQTRDLSQLATAFPHLLSPVLASITRGEATAAFASSIGCMKNGDGYVTGYIAHTVPVALHAAYTHPTDFRKAILAGISCGGDTDSVAAIIGGIVGAGVGIEGIPQDWRDGLCDYPRSIPYLTQLGNALTYPDTVPAPRVFLPALILRNLFFLCVVLYHGLHRLLLW
jgi:ADP-ribosyl-[dinitrogen reductase] hydrolase